MKKAILPLLLAVCLSLGGCASKNETRFERFSEELAARSDLRMTATVRAEYDDRSCSFTLRYADEPDGGCVVEVLEPELIRGVKARVGPEGVGLLYDSVAIDTGEDAAALLSPMGALPLLARALRSALLDSVWTEEGNCAVRLVPDDGVTVTVLFDGDMKPSCAEIAQDGRVRLFVDVTEFA